MLKLNMEPTNHPFRKEHDLNQTCMLMFHVFLRGVKLKSCCHTVCCLLALLTLPFLDLGSKVPSDEATMEGFKARL